MTTIALTGGTGFVGRQVLEALLARSEVGEVRALIHHTPLQGQDPRLVGIRGDLTQPTSLTGLIDGVDAVIHLACHIGDHQVDCDRINGAGTEALVALSRASSAQRLFYLSNAAVYGWAVHAGATEDQAAVAPATPISRSRARAERAVTAAGGIVLRPLFVDGPGDTRFVPAVARALARVPFLVSGGRARLSTVSVRDLARAIADLSTRVAAPPAAVFHATDQHPTRFRDMATAIAETFGLRQPRFSLPYPVARLALRGLGSRALGTGAGAASADHRLFLVSRDHWYDSTRLWRLLGWEPSLLFRERLAANRSWYFPLVSQAAG